MQEKSATQIRYRKINDYAIILHSSYILNIYYWFFPYASPSKKIMFNKICKTAAFFSLTFWLAHELTNIIKKGVVVFDCCQYG